MNSKFKIFWIGLVITMGLTAANCATTSGQDSMDESRIWKSLDGKHAIVASLVSYDSVNKTVLLLREDSTKISVTINQLSPTDRRYVAREMKKRRAATAGINQTDKNPLVVTRKENESSNQNKQHAGPPRADRQIGNSRNLYGIVWQPGIEDALVVAAGKQTPTDDRPIMWFRVLGDLEGFM